ncbi:hypothetical protein BC332_32665 [Capsicum chinense]|nr:hypothetical protein BC332_32665 [Capsicum chinense]
MAYASLSSLMHTLEQLLQPNQRLVCASCIQPHVESAHQSLCSVQFFLEDTTKEIKDTETLKPRSNKRLEVVAEEYLQDLIDRSLILAGTRRPDGRMKTCKIHDLLRQLCIRESQLDNFMHVLNDNDYTFSKDIDIYPRRVMLSFHVSHPEHGSVDHLTAQTDELTVTPVVGMGGIGKSTLATRVYHDQFIGHQFDTCAWVTVSENYNERQVLLDVVSSIRRINKTDESIKNINSDQLAEIAYRSLKGRRFLIVIDDLWSNEAWDQMQRLFPDDKKKSRILLTTRLKYVADDVSCPEFPPHNMSFLTSDDSWSLFTERLFRKDPCPPQLEPIGKHIIQHCQGLPFSITVIAGLLGKVDPTRDNWKKVEENLNSFFDMVVLANLPNLEVLKAHCGFIGTDWRLNENVVFQRLKYLRLEWEDLERWEAASDNFLMLEQLVLALLFRLEEIPQSIGEIMTLKLIQIEYCGSTVETSAKKIQQEQESWGNDELQVRIISRAGLGPERTISLVGWDVTGVSRTCVVRNARHGQDLGSDRDNHLGFVFRKVCCSYSLVNWDVEPLSTSSCVTSNPALDSWQSGSISFGRFENEALCWERRSSFTHNRYLKEVEKYIKPGSVTEKKAYFEELFRRRALLSQSSSDCQDGADSQASNDGSENTYYEGDFKYVNEIDYSACFVENHDRVATLLENGKYQASKNEGYAGRFEHVNEVGHSARFDENYDNSTHLSKNEKYQAKNTGYDGDSERVNETEQDTNSSDVLQSAPELLEAEEKFNLMLEIQLLMIQSTEEQPIARKVVASRVSCTEKFFMKIEEKVHTKEEETRQLQPRTQEKKEAEIKQLWRNLNFKAIPIPAFYREPDHRSEKIKVSSGSKANVLNQHKSTEEQPIARKVVASRAFCTEKVSHRLYQRVNRDKEIVNSCQPVVKQNGSSFRFKTEERARKRKEARTNFLCLLDKVQT